MSEVRRAGNESNCQDNMQAEKIKRNFRYMLIKIEEECPLKDIPG